MDLDTYTKNVSTLVSGGFISCAIIIGRELGLIDILRREKEPVTCEHLAEKLSLKKRYVEEWLGCMVASNIVFVDDNDRYYIDESLKPGLEATDVLAFYPLMTSLLNRTMECFKEEGPSGYGYKDMPSDILVLVADRVKDWNKMLDAMFELTCKHTNKDSFSNIMDLGCGFGKISLALAKRFPEAQVYGVDFMLNEENTTELAVSEGIPNVTFVKSDVADLPKDWTKKFDWVILMDVLHDLTCPDECMKEVRRVLKDDGVVTIVDPKIHSDHRSNADDVRVAGMGYAISQVFCLPFSLSAPGAPGLGMGWGIEKKEKFLTERGWYIKDKAEIFNPFFCSFTCVKIL